MSTAVWPASSPRAEGRQDFDDPLFRCQESAGRGGDDLRLERLDLLSDLLGPEGRPEQPVGGELAVAIPDVDRLDDGRQVGRPAGDAVDPQAVGPGGPDPGQLFPRPGSRMADRAGQPLEMDGREAFVLWIGSAQPAGQGFFSLGLLVPEMTARAGEILARPWPGSSRDSPRNRGPWRGRGRCDGSWRI